jgi:putative addiction module antidote
MTILKITSVGDETGVILPKEVLERLRVQAGGSLLAIETEQGIELVPADSPFAVEMQVAEEIMREDEDVLRRLAE